MWTSKPELKSADIDLDNDVKLTWEDRPVYRNGCIYFSTYTTTSSGSKNEYPDMRGF